MSRTKKGAKAPGYEFWSARPKSGTGHGPFAKKVTKRTERQQNKKLAMSAVKKSYWACEDCLVKAGGKSGGGVGTVMHGECAHCGLPATLIPWIDFDWPADRVSDVVAKVTRD